MSRPMLLCAVVLAVTLLSFYVHVLNEHMLRAQGLRTAAGKLQSQKVSERRHLPARHKAAHARAPVPPFTVDDELAAQKHLAHPAL